MKLLVAKIFLLTLIVSTIFIATGCKDNGSETPYNYPTTVSGKIKSSTGASLSGVKVTVITAPNLDAVYTDGNGYFIIQNLPQAKHQLKLEAVGYATSVVDVPTAINSVSTVNTSLSVSNVVFPSAKPLSKGPVRINNKVLETDFDGDGTYTPYVIKGVAYSPSPIGGVSETNKHTDRNINWLKSVNANTVRTYSGVGKYFLTSANTRGIKTIISFWVDYALDLSVEANRTTIKNNFSKMVLEYKDSPGLLMWNLGNEQNYQNGNTANWYSLVQELCKLAYQIEGETYHPIGANNGGFYNIGNGNFKAHDSTLTYMDFWAVNIYQANLAGQFANYRILTKKPVVLTEWGVDALDNRTGLEYEDTQCSYDSINWAHIRAASDVCMGGTVFEFTDEWWKAGNSSTHDNGGYATGAAPDGYANEEWWGIVAVTPDTDGDGLDEWRARKVFYMFQRNWK